MTNFETIGRLPVPGDNVAIATRQLDAGLEISLKGGSFVLSDTVLEGHRFAVKPIKSGEMLTSWGMVFGTATLDIAPGDYVCNAGVLEALRGRSIDFTLPSEPNFSDGIPPFDFEAYPFAPASQLPLSNQTLYFEGFDRSGRGVGTRNFIAIIGASSRVAGFVRRLAHEAGEMAAGLHNIDGVVPIAHTEGEDSVQLNKELVLRTLAGFFVHPNVCAALVVDHAGASITGKDLSAYMDAQNYPSASVSHAYLTLEGGFAGCLELGKQHIAGWLEDVNKAERSLQPLSSLKIALQCGGSDAFSGISGNPLAGWVAKAVIEQGGSANLAETDELIGAEAYVLKKVRSEVVARKFLSFVARFQERAARHGSSAAGNPSGGNKFRGLYNIYLKSLGAAMKRDPEVRLDAVIDYGERMLEPGYYFMDSPGNDLESIAGQVASGCNMIFFVTGNGSITNFPFVPTIKIVTTSDRYALLSKDMDVNAGAYLDGTPMDELGRQMLDETIDVASGKLSVGELAGHAQVQLWRNWRLKEGDHLAQDPGDTEYSGIPLDVNLLMQRNEWPVLPEMADANIGLVMPTSLCSGQISRLAASQLNEEGVTTSAGVNTFVSLVHTEGCGASSGASEDLFLRTMCGHLLHPHVRYAVLLEHGCEKTHNDYFRSYLEKEGVDTTRFGWASIQQNGGIEHAIEKIEYWFKGRQQAAFEGRHRQLEGPVIGVLIDGESTSKINQYLADLAGWVLEYGGAFVVPATEDDAPRCGLCKSLGIDEKARPTLNYAQVIRRSGMHLMAAPTGNLQELVAGLGATGVDLLVIVSDDYAVPAHPFIPTLQVGATNAAHLDAGDTDLGSRELIELVNATLAGKYIPISRLNEHYDFQISRGWQGVSL